MRADLVLLASCPSPQGGHAALTAVQAVLRSGGAGHQGPVSTGERQTAGHGNLSQGDPQESPVSLRPEPQYACTPRASPHTSLEELRATVHLDYVRSSWFQGQPHHTGA